MELSASASGTPNQLPPPVTPAADPAEPAEPSETELREQARKVLFAQEGEEEETEGEDSEKSLTEPAPPVEKPQEEAQAFSVDGTRQKILEVLKELSPEQRDQVLGTTDDAFAALTAKTREARKKHYELVQREQAFQAEKEEHSRLKSEWDNALIEGKSDPEKALSLFGWTLEDANNFFLEGKTIPAEKKYANLEERIQKTLEERLKPQEEQLKQAQEQIRRRETELNLQAWHSAVRGEISSMKTEEFPLAARWPKEEIFDAVTKLQGMHFSSTKKPLATKDALVHIEDRLRIQRKYLLGDGEVVREDRKTLEAEKGQSVRTPSARQASERVAPDEEDEPDDVKLKKALAALRDG
jgi:hypothetical protein